MKNTVVLIIIVLVCLVGCSQPEGSSSISKPGSTQVMLEDVSSSALGNTELARSQFQQEYQIEQGNDERLVTPAAKKII